MAKDEVEKDFPALKQRNYGLSDKDFNYNCLAFAMGDQHNWWEPPKGGGRYWPDGFPEDVTVQTVESIIRTHGYTISTDATITPETDAVAIYAEGNEWTHFAIFATGTWSSKLGDGHDVTHVQLQDLEGNLYGKVVKILRRPEATPTK